MDEWNNWIPTTGISMGKYDIVKMLSDCNGILIVLESKFCILEILFDGYVDAVREFDESSRLRSIENHDQYPISQWPFYKVKNSSFSEWIEHESYGFISQNNLIHYIFLTEDTFIEVLATYEPKVKILNKSESTL